MGVTPTTEFTTTDNENPTMNRPPVYRQLALPVPVFDYIKDHQRAHMARTGMHLSINQTVTTIVLGHQQNEEREARNKQSKQAAILHANGRAPVG